MSKKNTSAQKKGFFATLWRWLSRMFMGASKEISAEEALKLAEEAQKRATDDSELIVSPGKKIVMDFLERKYAVFALGVVVFMFIAVFVGPLFMPNYYDGYTEVVQQNIRPTMGLMSVPSGLKNDVKTISSFGQFSVGLSNSGKVYVWGDTKLGTTGIDIADIPADVQNANIVMVAAGYDHIIAVDDKGIVHGWGNNRFGQAHRLDADPSEYPNVAYASEDLTNGTLDVTQIKKLTCGYQCSAILMNSGKLYVWGNRNTYANLDHFADREDFDDVDFTLNYLVGVPQGGGNLFTGQRGLYSKLRADLDGTGGESVAAYLNGRTILSIAATSQNVCCLLSDHSVCFAGNADRGDLPVPELKDDEYFVKIVGGTHHYSGLTNQGRVYSWGMNNFGQAKAPKTLSGVGDIQSGAFQNYAVDENGKLMKKWGLSGYLFGTDNYGADIFQRIIAGGRMTMTIGAVAVIISSIIGIAVGCIAGYFGGKVDMVLMRVEEIFAAIPFLPFAMILSSLLTQKDMSENMRIFIIMCILGVLSWTGLARLVRGQVLVARENEYVTAAKAMGVKESRIAFRHILPNVISVILVTLTLDFAGCMLTESSLSYLGFGVTYPRPTWGNMLNRANNATTIKNFWWEWLFTAVILGITTICINVVGDALQDVMDPKSSSEK